jgi:hypothetical protein
MATQEAGESLEVEILKPAWPANRHPHLERQCLALREALETPSWELFHEASDPGLPFEP